MPDAPAVDDPRDDLSAYPWATLLAVLLTLIGAVVLIAGNSDLSYDQFTDYALAGWAALAVGRGLAAKPPHDLPQSKLSRTLNQLPWATVMIGIITLTGAIVLMIGESALAFDEYFQKTLLAAGVLGIARGLAAYKKDTSPLLSDVYDADEVYREPDGTEYDPEKDAEFAEEKPKPRKRGGRSTPLREAEGEEPV